MPCNLSASIPNDACVGSVPGMKFLLVTELSNIETLTTSGGTVTTLTLLDGEQFFKYDFKKQTGTFTETVTVSTENGSVYYQPEVSFQFTRMEVLKRNQLQLLAQNDVVAIVLDNNGSYWLTGYTNGLSVSAGTAQTGQALGDLNGYQYTLSGGEPAPMLLVPSNLIPALLVPAA